MAGVIQEVRAKFSATAQGLMSSIRDMREGIQGFGTESQEAVQDANHGMSNLSDNLNDLADSAEQTADSIHLIGEGAGGIGSVNTEIASAATMADRAEKGMKSFRKTFLSWTAAAAGVTLVAGYMGGLVAINEQYTQALNHVSAATGATADEQAELGQTMQDIYADNYGADFQDIADSLGAVKKATGLAGDALKGATTKAIALRDTFGYEVPESAKVADTMMKQFGITSDEAFELMATGAQQGLDKSDDMMDSFNEYSVYFKQLGFDAEGMWNVFKAGSESGAFNADKVGDAIKELGIRVKDGSKTSAEGFKTLGLDADKMSEMFAKGGESAQTALGQVFKGLADIKDPVERNAAGVALFGTQFEDLEYETIAALGTVRDQADMTGGAMEKLTEVKYDSIGQALTGIGRQLVVGLINPIQEKVMPVLNTMVDAIKNNMPAIKGVVMGVFNTITDVFAALAPTFMNVFGILKNIAPAILTPLGLAFKGLSVAIAPIINYITEMVKDFTGLSGFAPILGGIVAAFLAYNVGLKVAMAAQKAWSFLTKAHILITNAWRASILMLNSAWLANPIVLIVALLIGLGVALYMAYQKSETFREIVNKAWEGIKTGWEAVLNFFTTTIPQWYNNIVTWFGNLWNWVQNFFAKWGTVILAVVAPFIGIPLLIAQHWDTIKAFFAGLWDSITSAIGGFISGAIAKFNSFKELASGVFTNFVDNIKYIIEPFVTFFVQTWENLKNMVLGIVGVFTGLLTGDMEAVKNALTLIWKSIKSQIVNLVTAIKDTAIRIWNVLKSGLINVGNGIKTAVVSAWNGLKTSVSNTVNSIKTATVNTWNNLKSGVMSAVNGLKNGAISAWNSLKSSVSTAVSTIKSSVTNGFNSAKSAAVTAWNNLVNSVKTGVSNAVGKVKEMKSSIVSTVKGINLYEIGKNIVQGLVKGLANMLGSLKRKAKEIADTVKNAIKDKLKIHSPSRVMRGFGENVGEGLQLGIGSMIKSVGKVAGNMADAVTDNMGVEGALDGALNTSATVSSLQTFKHIIDLLNVPESIDEDSLKDMLLSLFKNPTVKRQIDRVNADNNLSYNRPMGAF